MIDAAAFMIPAEDALVTLYDSDPSSKQNFAEHLEILRLFREAPAAPFARLAQRLVVA